MSYLRRISTRRLLAICAAVVVAAGGLAAIALAATSGGPKPPPKPLAQALRDALAAKQVDGVTARIAPRHDGGLLGGVELAWDAEHGVPLRAAVYAAGDSNPVLELKATDISFGAVSAGNLTVPVPAGAKVVDLNPTAKDSNGRP